MQLTLAVLREAIQFESAILLEKSHGHAYRLIARVPGECGDGFTLPEEGLLIGRLRGYYPLPLTPGRPRSLGPVGGQEARASG
jgi:hypothetical protein